MTRYARRLEAEGCVRPGRVALACRNERVSTVGPADLAPLAAELINRLPVTAVILAEPLFPFPALLLRRALPGLAALVPRDSESRSSLHDIPLVALPDKALVPAAISAALTRRKGCIIDGIGMAAHGSLTLEQAYIAWSSLYHATFIKYHEDLLSYGMLLPEESTALEYILRENTPPAPPGDNLFQTGPLETAPEIIAELAAVGRATVKRGLVDSFFGNISYAGNNALYISQTSARLDELEQQIDPIPFDNCSTLGITASSELPTHRAIIAATGCRAVLHGHPRFPVVMSFFSSPTEHEGIDQVCGFPVVGGEGGQGGMARTVPRAFALTKARAVIVRGHGVFSIGQDDFNHPFAALVEVEQRSREEYCRRLGDKLIIAG
ncbi:MAG: class II aldolase/adducin family protein [Porticoccaceae bacterium]